MQNIEESCLVKEKNSAYFASRNKLVQDACNSVRLIQEHKTLANAQIIRIWQCLVYFYKTPQNLEIQKQKVLDHKMISKYYVSSSSSVPITSS